MRILLGLTIALAVISTSFATPISFAYTGSGSGSIGGTPFTNTPFVITALGDTNSRLGPLSGIYWIDHASAQIEINGVGSYSFLDPTSTYYDFQSPSVYLTRTPDVLLLGSTVPISGLAGWNMLTSIGPISTAFLSIQWENIPLLTSGGTLSLSGFIPSASFTATLVPEPCAFVLTVIASAGFVSRRRNAC
jgi:hypothetical protein